MSSTEVKFTPAVCQDIGNFQDYLKRLRTVDDSIILKLNTTILTTSFQKDIEQNITNCKQFHDQLAEAYKRRDNCIQTCLAEAEAQVRNLKEAKRQNESDTNVQKQLRREQTKQRLLQKEMIVEEIIQDRSMKALQERCRRYVSFWSDSKSILPAQFLRMM